jgi:hypothetical protein
VDVLWDRLRLTLKAGVASHARCRLSSLLPRVDGIGCVDRERHQGFSEQSGSLANPIIKTERDNYHEQVF